MLPNNAVWDGCHTEGYMWDGWDWVLKIFGRGYAKSTFADFQSSTTFILRCLDVSPERGAPLQQVQVWSHRQCWKHPFTQNEKHKHKEKRRLGFFYKTFAYGMAISNSWRFCKSFTSEWCDEREEWLRRVAEEIILKTKFKT